jgi:hypothetical protein
MEKKLSYICIDFIKALPDQGSSFQRIIDVFLDRIIPIFLFIIAFFNTILTLEDGSIVKKISGGLIVFLSLFIIFRIKSILLPKKIGDKCISNKASNLIFKKIICVLDTIEDYVHPRLAFCSLNLVERFFGLVIGALGVCMTMDLPLEGFLPCLAILFLSLGLLMKDGLHLLFGAFIAICIYAVLIAMYVILLCWLMEAFGF